MKALVFYFSLDFRVTAVPQPINFKHESILNKNFNVYIYLSLPLFFFFSLSKTVTQA